MKSAVSMNDGKARISNLVATAAIFVCFALWAKGARNWSEWYVLVPVLGVGCIWAPWRTSTFGGYLVFVFVAPISLQMLSNGVRMRSNSGGAQTAVVLGSALILFVSLVPLLRGGKATEEPG